MYPECGGRQFDRRSFLAATGGAMAALAAARLGGQAAEAQEAAKPLLPTVALGPHKITRLIAGYNPIGGFSHSTLQMSNHMREYFTAEQTAKFLQHCERQGINTWQYDHTDKTVEAIRIAREAGCGIQLICLHAERGPDLPLSKVMENKPLAIVHHGGVTDGMFRGGKAEQVHDFVKKVHDAGALAGVSAHCPDNIKRIADEGWENDLFMACFYYVSRPREDILKFGPKVPVGEPFFESDPDDMTAVMRQVKQPCLGFKILAAGRVCWQASSVENAFKYAFANIKPSDAVIVGMYPRFSDEVAENADYARKYGAA
ncbi:MAG: hypothetical protein FJX75_04895 [Armatimonadetes bacterium]|nr:hypothetical protein [Armatimonadota bacterium]